MNTKELEIDFNKTTDNQVSGPKKKSLYQISFLRVVASLTVCLGHFTCGINGFLPNDNPIVSVFYYGKFGVHVFFVISGFIICYSLPPNYSIKNFFIFLKKRLIRVEPPYLLSIVLTLLAAYMAAHVTKNHVVFSWEILLYHIGYINNLIPNCYYFNPVYWTLGIEFQFYLIIGLIFGLMNRSVYWLAVIILCFLALSYIKVPHTDLILNYLPVFCMGILAYFYMCKKEYSRSVLISLAVITLGVMLFGSIPALLVTLFTVVVIFIPFKKNKIITFLSNISYSLYLVHLPIGGRIVNMSVKYLKNDMQRYLVIALAVTLSIVAAYIFYLAIEKWTTRLSKKISYSSAN